MTDLQQMAMQMVTGSGLAVLPVTREQKYPKGIDAWQTYSNRLGDIPALWGNASDPSGAFLLCDKLPKTHYILDLDFSEDWQFQEFEQLTGVKISEVKTAISTPRGGKHLYIRCDTPMNLSEKPKCRFSNNAPMKIDVRSEGISRGIMLPGSRAYSEGIKAVGCYEAPGEVVVDLCTLQWTYISSEVRDRLQEVFGSAADTVAKPEGGSSKASEAMAVHLAKLANYLEPGFDTNDFLTTLAGTAGQMVRTLGDLGFIAEDLWEALVARIEHKFVVEQMVGKKRHKESFLRNFKKSGEITQAKLREFAAQQNQPKADALDIDLLDMCNYFGGRVGLRLHQDGAGTFALLKGEGRGVLGEDEWHHPDLLQSSFESFFSQKSGLSWVQSIAVALHAQGPPIPKGAESKWKEAIFNHSESDQLDHLQEMQTLKALVKGFDEDRWHERLNALDSPSKQGRWAWYMAPLDGAGRRNTAYIALWKGARQAGEERMVVAVPTDCVLSPMTQAALSRGGEPLASYSGEGSKKVLLWSIPEGLIDD